MIKPDLAGYWIIFHTPGKTWAVPMSSEEGARRVFTGTLAAGCEWVILCYGREVRDHSPHITAAAALLIACREHGRYGRSPLDRTEEFARA